MLIFSGKCIDNNEPKISLSELTTRPPEGIIAAPIDDENFFEWECLITGPGLCFNLFKCIFIWKPSGYAKFRVNFILEKGNYWNEQDILLELLEKIISEEMIDKIF